MNVPEKCAAWHMSPTGRVFECFLFTGHDEDHFGRIVGGHGTARWPERKAS